MTTQQYAPPPPQYQVPAPKQGLSITAMAGLVLGIFAIALFVTFLIIGLSVG